VRLISLSPLSLMLNRDTQKEAVSTLENFSVKVDPLLVMTSLVHYYYSYLEHDDHTTSL
jgi:hypothetical protein